jgi:hypothetical protein
MASKHQQNIRGICCCLLTYNFMDNAMVHVIEAPMELQSISHDFVSLQLA